jgi:hypothetical protein
MIRSYAVALTLLEIRVFYGISGFEQPFDWHVLETIVWSFTASALLVGDLANLVYEARMGRRGTARSTGRFAAAGSERARGMAD